MGGRPRREARRRQRIAGDADAYAREVAALTLAARVDPPVVPRLLGHDDARRVLVLEFVEARRPAGDWVVEYATGLARLHAATTADDIWGTVTARERLAHRLGVVAELTAGRDDLSGLGELSAAMRVRLLERHPGLRTTAGTPMTENRRLFTIFGG